MRTRPACRVDTVTVMPLSAAHEGQRGRSFHGGGGCRHEAEGLERGAVIGEHVGGGDRGVASSPICIRSPWVATELKVMVDFGACGITAGKPLTIDPRADAVAGSGALTSGFGFAGGCRVAVSSRAACRHGRARGRVALLAARGVAASESCRLSWICPGGCPGIGVAAPGDRLARPASVPAPLSTALRPAPVLSASRALGPAELPTITAAITTTSAATTRQFS